MASLSAFQSGIEYRDLILSKTQMTTNTKYSILDQKKATHDKQTDAEHAEYITQQQLLRIPHVIYDSFAAPYQTQHTVQRDFTTILAPQQCSCAMGARRLFKQLLRAPYMSEIEFLQLSPFEECDDFNDDSKAELIYYGSLLYCRHLITGKPVMYWEYIAPFLLGMIKYILLHPSDDIEIQPEISRRLRTKNKIIIEQLCFNLWILRVYDVLYGLRQPVPKFTQELPYYMTKAIANDIFIAHSCQPTIFSINIDYMTLAAHYKYVDPQISKQMIDVYVRNNMDHHNMKYWPCVAAESCVLTHTT